MSEDGEYSESSLTGQSLTTAMRVASSATIFSCMLVVGIFASNQSIRQKNINKVVFYICICQIGSAIGSMLGQPRNQTIACYVQSFLTNFFPFACSIWTTITSYMLYRVIHNLGPLDIFSRPILALCWGLPLVLSLLPLTTDTFGNEDTDRGWCFYRSANSSPEWTVTLWVSINYGFLCFAVVSSITCLSFSLYTVYGLSHSLNDKLALQKLSHSVSRFVWYPVISFICWLPEAVFDLNDSLEKGQSAVLRHDATFTYFAYLMPILEGLFVSIAYFSTSRDAYDILISLFCIKGQSSNSVGKPTEQFKYSSDPEDFNDDDRETTVLSQALSSSKSTDAAFNFKTGRGPSEGVELRPV